MAADDVEVATAEPHDMAAALELGETHELADQRLADEHALAAPLDFARGRMRRTSWSASYHGSSSRCGNGRGERCQCVAGGGWPSASWGRSSL